MEREEKGHGEHGRKLMPMENSADRMMVHGRRIRWRREKNLTTEVGQFQNEL